MSDTQVFMDEKYAPPREIVRENIERVMKGNVTIQDGAGANEYYTQQAAREDSGFKRQPPMTLCIMECASYCLGWDRIGDAPPCTSDFITEAMIAANDGFNSNRKRSKLRVLIEVIVNTAPYKYKQVKKGRGDKAVMVEVAETLDHDPTYKKLEQERIERFNQWLRSLPPRFSDRHDRVQSAVLGPSAIEWELMTAPMFIDIITELANMGHFAGHNGKQDVEQITAPEHIQVIEGTDAVGLPSESSSTTLPFGGDGQDHPTEERAPLQDDFPDSLPNTPPEGQASHEVTSQWTQEGEFDGFTESDTADAQEDQKREENE